MDIEKVKEKVKGFDWKKFFTSRNFIIVLCVMVIGAGIVVFGAINQKNKVAETESGTKVLGNTVLVGSEVSSETTDTIASDEDSYFAIAVINRERTRDEAMEILQAIADSPDSMPNVKEDALKSIDSMLKQKTAETNIENLVCSKGFMNCVAIVSADKCSVIVKSDGLLPDEVAQILAIAVEQTNLNASGITIIEKK